MLRYLPKRFSIKVTFITEAKDLKSLAIDELIGSLQTFEINLEDVKRNKIKVGTAKVDDENLDGNLDTGLDEEFLKTYKVEANESLIAEELDNFVKVKKELVGTKLMLKKFNTRSSKLNEILAARKKEPIKGGLGFVAIGKAVMESPIVFVKASGLKEVSERPKPMFFKLSKKTVHSRK
ncbi:hypothetical protein Gorai_024953, partial [Gossypium raimondii]|nr:hypothetical protein [Gossypium raimondii]